MKTRVFRAAVAACAASLLGFFIHVWGGRYVGDVVSALMEGKTVVPSWDVRAVAAITSIETGIGVVTTHILVRRALPGWGIWKRGVGVAVLALATQGRLFRQGIMDGLIGNPIAVVALQNGLSWATWLAVSLAAVLVLDGAAPDRTSRTARPDQM